MSSKSLKLLTLKTLAELDDSLPTDFEAMLAAAVKDCLQAAIDQTQAVGLDRRRGDAGAAPGWDCR